MLPRPKQKKIQIYNVPSVVLAASLLAQHKEDVDVHIKLSHFLGQ